MLRCGRCLAGEIVISLFRDRTPATLWVSVSALLAVIAAASISIFFYDRFLYAPDDGAYAHVADRVLRGEVLNGGVQDVHAGYINFVNAGAMAIFGVDFRSLRFPLAALNVLQALVVFLVLRRGGAWLALAGSLAVSSLSFVQFLNPTAHWYCLFLVLLIPVIISRVPRQGWRRLILLGLLVGIIAMFRQLTGVIVAIAVFGWLMVESAVPGARRYWIPRLATLGLALLLGWYVSRNADSATAALFGLGPVALLLVAGWQTSVSTRECLRMISVLSFGAALACLPLLVYHLAHGSLTTWFSDTVLAAFRIPLLAFIDAQSFTSFAVMIVPQLVEWRNPAAVLNALFWLTLILLPFVNGITLLRRLHQRTITFGAADALLWCASFYSLVALHYQIPIYLFYVSGLNAAALAASAMPARPPRRAVVAGMLAAVSAIALYFHAGQSLLRGLDGTMKGERGAEMVACGLPHCSLRIEPRDAQIYGELVKRIQTHSVPGDCILAMPSNAELYFVTERCNPTRFFNSALGLTTKEDVDALLKQLESGPPAMLIYEPGDKYSSLLTQSLFAQLRPLYRQHEKVGAYDVFWERTPPLGEPGP
jgi:hypothetical protein